MISRQGRVDGVGQQPGPSGNWAWCLCRRFAGPG